MKILEMFTFKLSPNSEAFGVVHFALLRVMAVEFQFEKVHLKNPVNLWL